MDKDLQKSRIQSPRTFGGDFVIGHNKAHSDALV